VSLLFGVLLLLQGWQMPAALASRFNQFPADEVFHGMPASPVLARPEERRFRTMIRLGAKEGPNFAGHYTVAEWGCGTECFQAVIVDAKTGKIYKPPTVDKNSGYSFESTWLHYRLDSRLLVACVNCRTFADRGCEQRYFVWERDHFAEISREPRRDSHDHISREPSTGKLQ
jgi:hypothetical protein